MSPMVQGPEQQDVSIAAPAGGDALWKSLTLRANQARERGAQEEARALYEAALAEAEQLFRSASDAASELVPVVPIVYNVSCHNLAQHLLEQGDEAGATSLFERAFDRLEQAAASELTPLPLRAGCARHLQIAAAPLVRQLVEQDARTQAQRYLERANVAISAVVELTRRTAPSEV